MLLSYFVITLCALKTKSTSQARIKSEIFVNFRPESDPKNSARLTTLKSMMQLYAKANYSKKSYIKMLKHTTVENSEDFSVHSKTALLLNQKTNPRFTSWINTKASNELAGSTSLRVIVPYFFSKKRCCSGETLAALCRI